MAAGTTLASRHTAPATTGEATLVPDRLLQPPWILLPSTSRPYATTSGCSVRRSMQGHSLPQHTSFGYSPQHSSTFICTSIYNPLSQTTTVLQRSVTGYHNVQCCATVHNTLIHSTAVCIALSQATSVHITILCYSPQHSVTPYHTPSHSTTVFHRLPHSITLYYSVPQSTMLCYSPQHSVTFYLSLQPSVTGYRSLQRCDTVTDYKTLLQFPQSVTIGPQSIMVHNALSWSTSLCYRLDLWFVTPKQLY